MLFPFLCFSERTYSLNYFHSEFVNMANTNIKLHASPVKLLKRLENVINCTNPHSTMEQCNAHFNAAIIWLKIQSSWVQLLVLVK